LYSSHLIADDGSIKMDANVDSAEYKETSPAYKMALIQGQDPPNHLRNLAYVLAIEGHADLVRLSSISGMGWKHGLFNRSYCIILWPRGYSWFLSL